MRRRTRRGLVASLIAVLALAAPLVLGGSAANAFEAKPDPNLLDLHSWKITQDRLGPYRLGETIAAAQRAGHVQWRKQIMAAVRFDAAISGDGKAFCPTDGQVNVPLVKRDWQTFVTGVIQIPCSKKPIAVAKWWKAADPLHKGHLVGMMVQRFDLTNHVIGGRQIGNLPVLSVKHRTIHLLGPLPAPKRLFAPRVVKHSTYWDGAHVTSVFAKGTKHIDPATPRLAVVIVDGYIDAIAIRSAALNNPAWNWSV